MAAWSLALRLLPIASSSSRKMMQGDLQQALASERCSCFWANADANSAACQAQLLTVTLNKYTLICEVEQGSA